MANFWWGLWNGITAWPLLIIHAFGALQHFVVYDVARNTGWYQLASCSARARRCSACSDAAAGTIAREEDDMDDDCMRAAVFRGAGAIRLEEKPVPIARPGEALIRVTLTTICGTDVHILKGEYPVSPGSPSATSRWEGSRRSAPA